MIGVVVAIVSLQVAGISGELPLELRSARSQQRVAWLAADDVSTSQAPECRIVLSQWACPTVARGEPGVVLIEEDGLLGYIVLGRSAIVRQGSAEWGRLVRIASLPSAPSGPSGPGGERPVVQASVWTLDRPANRPGTLKLDMVPGTSHQVIQVSETSFWISGPRPSLDDILRLDGVGIARRQVPLSTLASAAAGMAFAVDTSPPVSIGGRIETRSGNAVEDALVELFVRSLAADDGRREGTATSQAPLIRLATVSTDAEGRFEFEGLEHGEYQIVATAFAKGRLSKWTTTADPPVLMKLTPPATVTGRVVRRKRPAAGVRVRFTPSTAAWSNSTDPSAHLTADISTDDGGRFALPLPPEAVGDVQFIAPDGASVRITLPAVKNLGEVAIGDVTLPEPIPVDVRANVAGCSMRAMGPAGSLGLAVVTARSLAEVYQLELPEAGQWFLSAECSGQPVPVEPAVIDVRPGRSPALFDVHITLKLSTNSRLPTPAPE